MCLFIETQTCSIKFKSGLYGGHSMVGIRRRWKFDWVSQGLWHGALSCWYQGDLPILCSTPMNSSTLARMRSSYFSEFMEPHSQNVPKAFFPPYITPWNIQVVLLAVFLAKHSGRCRSKTISFRSPSTCTVTKFRVLAPQYTQTSSEKI